MFEDIEVECNIGTLVIEDADGVEREHSKGDVFYLGQDKFDRLNSASGHKSVKPVPSAADFLRQAGKIMKVAEAKIETAKGVEKTETKKVEKTKGDVNELEVKLKALQGKTKTPNGKGKGKASKK